VRKCEANALVTRPDAGRGLCHEAIQNYVDLDAADDYLAFISSYQEEIRENIIELMGAER